MLQQAGEDLNLTGKLLVAALHGLLGLVNAALYHFHISHYQFQIDNLNVAQRIRIAFHMGNIAVFKAADNMDDGIGGADVREELVAQTFALGSALYEACDVHEFDDSRGDLLGLMQVSQPVDTLIGNRNHTHIGVDGAECVVVCRYTCVGDSIKEGGLANIGKSYDT